MSSKLRFASVLLVATLIVVAGCSVLMPNVYAVWHVTLQSRQDNGATTNKGTITVQPTVFNLPFDWSGGLASYSITYNPASGYVFVRW
jgi:hypothetical protein